MIEAQERMMLLEIADFPQMKKHDRMKVRKRLIKTAYRNTNDAEEKRVTTSELATMLSGEG